MNGSHDAEKLQDLLDGFIRKYVLCPECDNPETDLKVSTKKGTIAQSCKACGFHGPLEVHHKVRPIDICAFENSIYIVAFFPPLVME